MYRQRLDKALRGAMEARAEAEFKAIFDGLGQHVDSVHVEKTKAAEEGHQMVANLSCLVSDSAVPAMKAALEPVRRREGLSVRLAGPLPPYSFC